MSASLQTLPPRTKTIPSGAGLPSHSSAMRCLRSLMDDVRGSVTAWNDGVGLAGCVVSCSVIVRSDDDDILNQNSLGRTDQKGETSPR